MDCRFCGRNVYLDKDSFSIDTSVFTENIWSIKHLYSEEIPHFQDMCNRCLKEKLRHPKVSPFVSDLCISVATMREFNKYDFPRFIVSILSEDYDSDSIIIGGYAYSITKNNASKLIGALARKVSKKVAIDHKNIRNAIANNDIELLIDSLDKEVIFASAKKRGRFTQNELSELCNVRTHTIAKYMKLHHRSYLYSEIFPHIYNVISLIRRYRYG